MNFKNNITDTIGKTPLVKINHILEEPHPLVFAKLEYFNPGLSVKDRIGNHIIKEALSNEVISPGGTVIECTSGNTGIGITITCNALGLKSICILNTKHSKEKIKLLKAYGAEVIICPANVPKEHPDSTFSVASRLNEEIPNSMWVNQYQNPKNPESHFLSTGPEIWKDTDGKITHLIASGTTGGTISGSAKFLKSKNPNIQVWAADAYGSAFKHFHETGIFNEEEVYPYKAENVGKNYIPSTMDFSLVDHFEKVDDGAAALSARALAEKEGLLLGYSSGAAFQVLQQKMSELKPEDVVVVMCPDHGSRYLGTIYNDQWMKENKFLELSKTL